MSELNESEPAPVRAFLHWLLHPPVDGPAAILLLRVMAGGVFLWEGILKFVYVNQGVGRFVKLGFPEPQLTAHFVGGLEIVGGLLVLAGLATRVAAIPFVVEMMVAWASTKIALFLGTSPLHLPSSPPTIGVWAVLHEMRSEWAQLLTMLFLIIEGPGQWSLDARLARSPTSVVRAIALATLAMLVALAGCVSEDGVNKDPNLLNAWGLAINPGAPGAEDGRLTGWQTGTTAQLRSDQSASEAIYKGLAIVGKTLWAANFHAGTLDVFDDHYTKLATAAVDPDLPHGFAPFNVASSAAFGKLEPVS